MEYVIAVGRERGILGELPSVHVEDQALNNFEIDEVVVIEVLVSENGIGDWYFMRVFE